MPTLGVADLDELRRSARALLRRDWPDARHAARTNLSTVWSQAVEAGWFDTANDDLLRGVFAIIDELGRAACPLPMAEAFVASQLFPELENDIARGVVRPGLAMLPAGSSTIHVEAAPVITHALRLTADHRAELHTIRTVEVVRGVPTPPWYKVALAQQGQRANDKADEVIRARLLLQLSYAARALAAARRAHELALDYARQRRQFGKLVGSFGAVQQRSATCQIDADAGELLVEQAIRLYEEKSYEWPRASQVACAFVKKAARRVQLGAHHTLAASGFFEESEAPWLFRRLHADIALLLQLGDPGQDLGNSLIRSGTSLPNLGVSEIAARFRAELRGVLDGPEVPACAPGIGPDDDAVVQQLATGCLAAVGQSSGEAELRALKSSPSWSRS